LRIPATNPIRGLSLRRLVLLTVALVAIAGTIYGATSGARRAISPRSQHHVQLEHVPGVR
jgi:hypothetical protein